MFTKLFKKKSTLARADEDVAAEKDSVFELKKMIMEKYRDMMNIRKCDQIEMDYGLLIESSFINDSCFLPPMVVNKKIGTKLIKTKKLEVEQVRFLLIMILFNQSLAFQESMIKFSGIGLKSQYINMQEQTIKSLMLSGKQKKMILKWKKLNRNVELFPANGFSEISSSNIIQGFIGDCSFIVVLSLLLEHEKKFGSKLLSNLITSVKFSLSFTGEDFLDDPELNDQDLDDILSLYACKLLINGIWRSIYIDDSIPVDHLGNCLLSHFDDSRYFGITLIEKAYLKVMANRYDSIGSNPAIDLYYLTGWIPETISIRSVLEGSRNKSYFSKIWNRIKFPIKNGYCLMALGTNEISPTSENDSLLLYPDPSVDLQYKYIGREEICRKTGLVSKHAYQVLRVVELLEANYSVKRLLLLRNPWGKISWRGRFSIYDNEAWKEGGIGNELLVDGSRDNGIFWIEWNDILKWFSHIYLAWDPEKVSGFSKKLHGKWTSCPHNSILKDDLHLMNFYPQYKISFDGKLFNKVRTSGSFSNELGSLEAASTPKKSPQNANNRFKIIFDSKDEKFLEDHVRQGGILDKLWKKSDNSEATGNIGDIWIVLNRHIDYLDFKCEQGKKSGEPKSSLSKNEACAVPFMSISIFRGGDRVVTQERLPIIQGVYSDGHVIMYRTNISQLLREYNGFDMETKKEFVLVITQYQSNREFNYSLNFYSNIELSIIPLENPFQPLIKQPNPLFFVNEISGKVLHHNYCEKFCLNVTRDNKICITPVVHNRSFPSTHSASLYRNTSQTEQLKLLILLETSEKCEQIKLKLLPETFDFQDRITKLSSSNDAYNNSNCKFISAICCCGTFIILVDFKSNKLNFIRGNLFKLIIYSQKL
ncbi:calpain family cysteine protease domain-containing protein [Cryptosporidium felis]|nr:calpain family cysteine protease domain-containing protein [Cryptosporidium felis]